MTTPIIILGLLILPFLCGLGGQKISSRPNTALLGGLIGYAIAFVFFSIGHFVKTDEMMAMLPGWVPMRHPLIYATGVLEALIAVALLWPKTRKLAGLISIAIFIGFFPANVWAAFNHTGMGGHQWGPEYLLIRAPLQAFLIVWGYWFSVRPYIPLK